MADFIRYSDQELQEFKDLINNRLEEAKKDLVLLKESLSHNNNGTDDTAPSQLKMEDGSEARNREETAQLASRQERYIMNLKDALVRIENKTYGICRATGVLIRKERLKLVPHATLSIDAKNEQDSKKIRA